jgi:hypothetical protein
VDFGRAPAIRFEKTDAFLRRELELPMGYGQRPGRRTIHDLEERRTGGLVRDYLGKVDIEPSQSRRQRQAVCAGVESGSQVENGIDRAFDDQTGDDLVEDSYSDDQRPRLSLT